MMRCDKCVFCGCALQTNLRSVIDDIRLLQDPVVSVELWALAQSVCDTEEVREQQNVEEWAHKLASNIVDHDLCLFCGDVVDKILFYVKVKQ